VSSSPRKSGCGLRLLDVGVAQVGAAGVRGTQRPAVLSSAIRGEESSKNEFYTGAAPNQQAIPAVDYRMNEIGVERWVLAGADYVYPRTTNKILEQYLKDHGVAKSDIMISYTPLGGRRLGSGGFRPA